MLMHMQMDLTRHLHTTSIQVESTVVTSVVLQCIKFHSTLMPTHAEQSTFHSESLHQSSGNGLQQLQHGGFQMS